jgi:hypothetical protein
MKSRIQPRLWAPGTLLAITMTVSGQTAVDLKTQSKSVDFSGAQFTRPVKVGTTLPATCQVGEMYFKADASPGNNLYACIAGSTWAPLLTSGFTGTEQLTEFQVQGDGSELVVKCPECRYRIGQKVFVLSGDMTASGLTGTGGPSTIFIYLDGTGVPKFGYDGAVITGGTFSGLAGQSGVTQTPSEGIPVASCTVAGNQFGGCTDLRAAFSRSVQAPGTGIAVVENPTTGVTTISVNPAVVALLGGANTWTGTSDFTNAEHTSPAKTGTMADRPTTCEVGELYFATDGTAGKNLHFCTSPDTWTQTP